MIAFDATVLIPLLHPDARVRPDATGKKIAKVKERLDYLVSQLTKSGEKIIVPTPALSEVLVHAGPAMNDWLNILNKRSTFRIADFDQRAAIEVAILTAEELRSKKGKKVKALTRTETVAKVKYDRQIAAIAKAEGATALYTDDDGLAAVATKLGLKVVKIADLPLPPEDAQLKLSLDNPEIQAAE